MDANKLLTLLPTATLPTDLVLRLLSVVGQLANSSQTYPDWSLANRLLIEQAREAETVAPNP
jgi:hypothetical protein